MKTFNISLKLKYIIIAENKEDALAKLTKDLETADIPLKKMSSDNLKIEEVEEEEEEEERFCTKCGKTAGLLEDEDICYSCATERGRC